MEYLKQACSLYYKNVTIVNDDQDLQSDASTWSIALGA
jgi:hypothetical protein